MQASKDLHQDPGLGPGLAGPATTGSAQPAPADRSTEFVAVEGGKESTSAEALLVSAYVVMWAVLFAFLWFGFRRQQRLDKRLVDLEKALGAAERR